MSAGVMAEFPALPLWTDAYMADTSHLTYAEHGLYLHMLMTMWRTPGCQMPNDRAWIDKRFHGNADAALALCTEFCTLSDDGKWWHQKRLRKQWAWCKEKSEKNTEIANNRWDNTKSLKNNETEACERNANAMPLNLNLNPNLKEREGPASPDTPPLENGQPRRKQTVFPEGWKPGTDHFARAQDLGLSNLHVERAAKRFEDHNIAKGSMFADWDRAFNVWLDRDAEHLGKPAHVNGASNSEGFVALPGSAAFSAWKAHCTDHSDDPKCRALKYELENRELSGHSFNFETEWPPQ